MLTDIHNSYRKEYINMLKEVKYDPNITLVSLDGFRIQITPSMALKVAEERGYKIDTEYSNVTFQDLISSPPNDKTETIYLSRIDTENGFLQKNITLTFEDNRVMDVDFDTTIYGGDKDDALKLLNSVLKRYPYLTLSKTEENFVVYFYKPNKHAFLSASASWKSAIRVSVHVRDGNYKQAKMINDALNSLRE